MTVAPKSRLFQPLTVRGLTIRNRTVVSPMCQYSATDGVANDWHFVHLGQFAMGGFGLVFTEATAVEARGRITHGDLGLWNDAQIAPVRRIADYVKSQGAAFGMQIGHAGRKASMQRPWFGNGPLNEQDRARGELPWEIVAPSAIPMNDGWLMPTELSVAEIGRIVAAFGETAKRAHAAGVDVVEVHGAHGYLTHTFLSPISNKRTDAYGGDRAGRMRFAIEVSRAVRAAWPDNKPVFFRTSSVDGIEGGWALDDTVALAKALKEVGVDAMDCSSGGVGGPATAGGVKRQAGFQVPFAETVKRETGLIAQAVGLIVEPRQAEAIIAEGRADLVAVAREALVDPHWAGRAAIELAGEPDGWAFWPAQYGWWLERRRLMFDRKAV